MIGFFFILVSPGAEWKFIPNGVFKDLPKLILISIVANSISTIEKDDFTGASNIEKLVINHNPIQELGPNVFEHLKVKIENIDLQDNNLEFIHQKAFESLQKLTDLNLKRNHLFMIHESTFSGLKKLNKLNLKENVCLSVGYENSSEHFTQLPMLVVKEGCHYSYMKRISFDDRNEQRVALNVSILCNVCSFIFCSLVIVATVLVLKFCGKK